MSEQGFYTKKLLKAINDNQEAFKKMLGSVIESPYQNEHGYG